MVYSSNSQGSGAWWSKVWAAGTEKRIQQIQKIRDDGTTADEVLNLTRDRIIPLTLIFSFIFCLIFYFRFLSDAYPIWVAIPGAAIIAFVIENGKIFFGIRAIRYLYFYRPLSSIADTVLFIGILLFSVLTFYWSIQNSTSGLHDLTTRTIQAKTAATLNFSPDVTAIDRQIAEARAAQQKADGMRWKGKMTVEGQRLTRRSEEGISKLQDQRTRMIDQAQKQYDAKVKVAENNTEKAASWTRLIGGFIEAAQIILLIIAGSCEKKLDDRLQSGKTIQRQGPAIPYQGHPIGFNLDLSGNVRAAAPPRPVNGHPQTAHNSLYHNVPQDNGDSRGIGADAILKNAHAAIQRDLKNLENENGRPRTICDRIHAAIIQQSREVRKKGFEPSPRLATDYYTFLRDTVFPTLAATGRPYEYAKQVLEDLEEFIDEQELSLYEAQKPQA